jgi:hypothetical protein
VLAAYPLDPWAWSGRAGFGQFWFTPGPVTVLVDAVLWAGVAAIGAGWGVATAEAAPGTGDDARRPSYG